jgi:menaquinone-dependent protoporphyrinogen IX oxidase
MMGGTMLEKVLIVYATSHGQTAAIARAVAAAAFLSERHVMA